MNELLIRAFAMEPHLRDLRRRLHQCPEVGMHLPQTFAVIEEELTRLGLPFSRVGRSLCAELGPETEETVLLRADCDGLGISEETNLPYRSQKGTMHACGHDLHAAALLGAAALLKETEASLSRRVRLLFQPGEELLEGAKDAVAGGICEGVSEAYMLHVSVGTGLPTGTVILPPSGVVAPSADFFSVSVEGKGCHGADPASGTDPLTACARICLTLEHLPAREFPSGARAALTVGALRSGDSFNVIPHRGELRGTLRCFDEDLRRKLRRRVEEICHGIALAHGVRAELAFPSECPSLLNDEDLRTRSHALLSAAFPERFFSVEGATGGGSEDFAFISHRVPSLMLALAAGDSPHPLHHPKVIFDEDCLSYGAAVLATLASGRG